MSRIQLPGDSKHVRVDRKRKLILLPGETEAKEMPTVLASDGKGHALAPAEMDERERVHLRRNVTIRQWGNATWKCSQCHRECLGWDGKIKWATFGGVKAEYLFCPDDRCQGPCVMLRDPLDLKAGAR